MSEKLEFKVSSALKSIVGKDLITNDHVAIFEIVKNSFDARANHVKITFAENTIIIADNGKGMSLDDIKNKWLFLAYSAKKDGTEDIIDSKDSNFRDKIQQKRYYAGAKGIGRFSSDRLGQELTLVTKTIDEDRCEKIFVDWNKFEEDQKKEFVDIQVIHDTIDYNETFFPANSLSGTVLIIQKLNDSWPRHKLLQLRRSLEKLINPFNDQNEFIIEISCVRELHNDDLGNDEAVNGILKNTILDALNFKTTGIEVHIDAAHITTQITDRGDNKYTIHKMDVQCTPRSEMRLN